MDIQKELLHEFDREAERTRKILQAIPDGVDFAWKPSEKSMELGSLAAHVTDMFGDWAYHALAFDKLEFAADHKWEAFKPTSSAELVERFDKGLAPTRAALASISPEKWDQNWKFIFGGTAWVDQPRYQVFRESVMDHLVHHRAARRLHPHPRRQASRYLRSLG